MVGTRLFHVSEEAELGEFHPRPAPPTSPELTRPVVWAIDALRLSNYLLPRECPRVCYAAGPDTTAHDREHFFQGSKADRIIAIEAGWRDRITACRLFVYEMPPATFVLHDADAGYWLSDTSVTSIGTAEMTDLLAEQKRRGVELRFLPSLWSTYDAVMASSLCFSAIRMRNAQPRPNA